MSAESLQRDGRAAYEKGDFTKALEYFNRAVGRGDPSVKLLDSVAATHIRLGTLEAALAAAKKTVQNGREDATGYLRAGQILIKMDKPSTALEIYAHGLKKIKHAGAGFEKLKNAHDELLQQLAPKNSVDPLTVLPRELAIAVLEYLNFRQRIAICRVSKGWTTFIRSEPTLWSHLDFSGAKKKVRTGFISKAINAGRNKITAATLNMMWDFEKVLAAVVKHCPLEAIKLGNTGMQGQSLVDAVKKAGKLKDFVSLSGTQIGNQLWRQLLDECGPRLETLGVASLEKRTLRLGDNTLCPQLPLLKSFDVEATDLPAHWDLLRSLTTNSPALQSIRLRVNEERPGVVYRPSPGINFRACANLTHLDLLMPLLSYTDLTIPSSLRVLRLASNLGQECGENFFRGSDEMIPEGLKMWKAPHLEEVHLNFPGLNFYKAATQFDVVPSGEKQPLSTLRSFSMQRTVVDDLFDPFALRGRLAGVQHLCITDTWTLKDEHVEALLQGGKKLESLNLSGTSITGVSVKSVVSAGHVKRLVINDCGNISRDAIDWAKEEKGLQVEFKMTNHEKGGKRVRY